jgi:hypothetical protein
MHKRATSADSAGSDSTMVFTGESMASILRDGGTSSWRLNQRLAVQRQYTICTRNTGAAWCEGREDHRAAFLVGKVLGVVSCGPRIENNESTRGRYRIVFSHYALIDIPEAWPCGMQNPVHYTFLSSLGVDPNRLDWKRMPNAGKRA